MKIINSKDKKESFAAKIVTRYDDIIRALTEVEMKGIVYILKKNENLRGEIYSPVLADSFVDYGFMTSKRGAIKMNINGKLFLEYFKETHGNKSLLVK